MTSSLLYILPDEKTKIVFSDEVLKHMLSFIQDKGHLPEAGGQLFSKNPDNERIVIDKITGPYPTDRRSRYSWVPDTKKMSDDRERLFHNGWYIVGLWHTHPELKPKSSLKDKITCEKHLQLLDSAYKGFLLITIGNECKNLALATEYLERINHKWHKLRPPI